MVEREGASGRATIRDVARLAEVSVATVSRVLNATGQVSAAARQRVLAAAEQLGYVPNSSARSLITRRTQAIGVVLPDLHGEFFSELLRGIDLGARRRGYHVLISSSHSDLGEMAEVLRAMRGRVDGLIVMAPDADVTQLPEELRAPLPAVVLGATPLSGRRTITVDNYGGARQMTEALLGFGHQRIAFVQGPHSNADARERRRGWRDAMAAAGLPTAGLELPGAFTEESGYVAAVMLGSATPRPTALFCANDAMAIGALRALREIGVRVPAELALAGFDDIPVARCLTPPLASVHVPIADLGARAVSDLLDALQRNAAVEPGRVALPTELVLRESCGAPAERWLERPR